MQFPKLTPLQSRLAACLLTFILLIILFFSISPSQFAYAAELDSSILNQDHNHHRILEWISNDVDWGEEDDLSVAPYQADFAGFDRSIIGRASSALTELKDNIPVGSNVASGQTQYFVFLNSSLWADFSKTGNGLPPEISQRSGMAGLGNVSQSSSSTTRNVYISVMTCTRPGSNGTSSSIVPQLTLYVSTTDANQSPGPDKTDDQQSVPLRQGSSQLAVSASGNVYVGVAGPSNATSTSSQWSFEVSASIDDYDLYSTNANFTYVIDTDSNSALISTFNLTDSNDTTIRQKWADLSSNPPFQLFVFNSSDPGLTGIQHSYCGLSQLAASGFKVNSSITIRNDGQIPKQQFYVDGLQPGQTYSAFLAYKAANQGSNTPPKFVGGGGQVWNQLSFTTKSDGNCKVIHGLDFCSDVAYAVPSNSSANMSTLVNFYDNNAKSIYQNFAMSLQQIPCNTTNSAKYSLARNCTNCQDDYKTWLCAVTIPRCDDFSSSSPNLAPRNVAQQQLNGSMIDLSSTNMPANATKLPWFNQSRLPLIDQQVKPGPYKELLPCIDLCYDIVRSCPAVMGFSCPRQVALMNKSYGIFNPTSASPICNFLGRDPPTTSAASGQVVPMMGLVVAIGVLHLILSW